MTPDPLIDIDPTQPDGPHTMNQQPAAPALDGRGPATDGEPPIVEIERIDLEHECAEAALIWLNRPDALNAISWEMVTGLEKALVTTDNDERICTVLISGRGRAFSAGGDLKSYLALQRDPEGFPRFLADLHRTFGAIRTMRKPVVALVNGVTAAGGLELLLSCDFAYAAASARIGDAHLNYGQIGGGGALALLPRMLGPARARELLFSGDFLPAEEALGCGIVNRVVPDDTLVETGLHFARKVAAKSPTGIEHAKYVMNAGYASGVGLEDALRLERERNAFYCLNVPDAQEGLSAFAEKRRPQFGERSPMKLNDRPVERSGHEHDRSE